MPGAGDLVTRLETKLCQLAGSAIPLALHPMGKPMVSCVIWFWTSRYRREPHLCATGARHPVISAIVPGREASANLPITSFLVCAR